MSITREVFRRILAEDATIAGLVGPRISEWPLPQKSAMPAITFFQVSGAHGVTQDGEDGTARARYQVDSWGSSSLQAATVATAVRNKLNGYKGTVGGIPFQGAFLTDESDEFEPEAGRYRCRQDVTLWTEED